MTHNEIYPAQRGLSADQMLVGMSLRYDKIRLLLPHIFPVSA